MALEPLSIKNMEDKTSDILIKRNAVRALASQGEYKFSIPKVSDRKSHHRCHYFRSLSVWSTQRI